MSMDVNKGAAMNIELSALGPTISEQLAAAGYEAAGKPVALLDRLAHAVTLAYVHGILTGVECDRARKRLVREIQIRPIQRAAQAPTAPKQEGGAA